MKTEPGMPEKRCYLCGEVLGDDCGVGVGKYGGRVDICRPVEMDAQYKRLAPMTPYVPECWAKFLNEPRNTPAPSK